MLGLGERVRSAQAEVNRRRPAKVEVLRTLAPLTRRWTAVLAGGVGAGDDRSADA